MEVTHIAGSKLRSAHTQSLKTCMEQPALWTHALHLASAAAAQHALFLQVNRLLAATQPRTGAAHITTQRTPNHI